MSQNKGHTNERGRGGGEDSGKAIGGMNKKEGQNARKEGCGPGATSEMRWGVCNSSDGGARGAPVGFWVTVGDSRWSQGPVPTSTTEGKKHRKKQRGNSETRGCWKWSEEEGRGAVRPERGARGEPTGGLGSEPTTGEGRKGGVPSVTSRGGGARRVRPGGMGTRGGGRQGARRTRRGRWSRRRPAAPGRAAGRRRRASGHPRGSRRSRS